MTETVKPAAAARERPTPRVLARDDVALVLTNGHGSMDLYARKLAECLPVPTLEIDPWRRSGEAFGIPLASVRAARRALADLGLVRTLRAAGAALHLPNHHLARYGPFLSRPYVLTVHDVIRVLDLRRGGEPLIHPPTRLDRAYLGLDVAGIRRAAGIVVPSHATRRDLLETVGLPEARVTVVPNGVDHEIFRPREGGSEEPYVLFVGSEHPRKNLATVFRALARLVRDARFRRLRLVKVGGPGGGEARFREQTLASLAAAGVEDRVTFVERLEAEGLAGLYAHARCFVLPSLHEGFGLPPLEAMACGCPVVASNAAALPELVGDAGLLVDPLDDRALADALAAVLADDGLYADLRARGLARAAEFSWERTARETLAAYERFL
ncbi:MAG: glycosyltransferase family 4 protein [Thermoleophilia bacterium]|nr:glycosyltransferase family 4 protein [Thermoleophilia bacterium]